MLGRDVWNEPGHALTNVIDVTVTLLRKKLDQPGLRTEVPRSAGSGEFHNHRVDGEAVARLSPYRFHHTIALRAQNVLHLHRFDYG